MGMKRMTKAEILATYTSVSDQPDNLRFRARLAYLDGRTKYAKELNRRADVLEAEKRRRVA